MDHSIHKSGYITVNCDTCKEYVSKLPPVYPYLTYTGSNEEDEE